jgi:cytoskeletal protein RodZ
MEKNNKNEENKVSFKGLAICLGIVVVFVGLVIISSNMSTTSNIQSNKTNSSVSNSTNNGSSSNSSNYKSNSSSSSSHKSNSSSSGSSSSNSSTKKSGGCTYKYSNGSKCGKTVGSHSPLCDYHFNQLDSTYKSLTGGY